MITTFGNLIYIIIFCFHFKIDLLFIMFAHQRKRMQGAPTLKLASGSLTLSFRDVHDYVVQITLKILHITDVSRESWAPVKDLVNKKVANKDLEHMFDILPRLG